MKKYYIKIECPQDDLCQAEKDVLEVAKNFDGCLICESEIDLLMDYFKNFLDNFLEPNQDHEKINLSDWSSFMDDKCMRIGKVRIKLKGLKDMPADFNEFCNQHKFEFPYPESEIWVRDPYYHWIF